MTPSWDFYIDCLVSLGAWKIIKKPRNTIRQYRISQTETYNARRFSMDACLIYENCILKVYDPYITQLKPKSWVIDVGGHIGTFSTHLAKRFSGLRIISLEPHPQSFRLLKTNVTYNNLESTITSLQMGVAKAHGTGRLFTDTGNSGEYSMTHVSKRGRGFPIQLTTLSSIFSKYTITKCALLKLDCEGAEFEILTHASLSVLNRVETIIMETHAGYDLSYLLQFLRTRGFSVRSVPNAISHPILKKFLTVPLSIATR